MSALVYALLTIVGCAVWWLLGYAGWRTYNHFVNENERPHG